MSQRNVHLLESLEPRIMLSASLVGVAAVEAGAEEGLSVEVMPAMATEFSTAEGAFEEGLFAGMQPIPETPLAASESTVEQEAVVEEGAVSTASIPPPVPSDVETPADPDAASTTLDQLTESLVTGQGPPVEEPTFSLEVSVFSKGLELSLFSGTSISWLGGSGNWNDGTKWAGGSAPGSNDQAVINGTGNFTITLNTQDVTVSSLIVNAGKLDIGAARTLTVTDDVTIATGATVNLAGNMSSASMVLGGTLNVTGSGNRTLSFGTLTGSGTLAVSASNTYAWDGFAVTTLTGLVNMTGTISLTPILGKLVFQSNVTVGTLAVGVSSGFGSNVPPTVTMAAPATLTVTSELRMGLGTLEVEELHLGQGTLFNLTLTGDKMVLASVVTINGSINWTSGSLLMASNDSDWTFGPTAVASFGTTSAKAFRPIDVAGLPVRLTNQGTLTFGVGGYWFGGTTFTAIDFTNAGTMRVLGGGLNLDRDFTQTGGLMELSANSYITTYISPTYTRKTFYLNGGELRGIGEVNSHVINGGVIRPGLSDGTRGRLTVVGSFTQSPTGRVVIEALGFEVGLYNTLQANTGSEAPVLAGAFELVPLAGFAAKMGDEAKVLFFFNNPVEAFVSLVGLAPTGYEIELIPDGAGGYKLKTVMAPLNEQRMWDGGGDGVSFGDALNWEDDMLPNRLETAVIAPTTAITVNLTGHTSAGGLILDGADAAVTLNMGNYNFTDSNPLSVDGVVVRSGATLQVGTGSLDAPLMNEVGGTVKSTGRTFVGKVSNLGRFEISGATTTWNTHQQTGELVLNGGALWVYGNFINEGVMRVTQVSSLTVASSYGSRLQFINKGTLELRAFFSLSTAAITNEGTWDQDGVSISFNALNANGAFFNPGVFNLRNDSHFYIYGGVYVTIFSSEGDLWVDATSSISVGGSINQLNANGRTQIDGEAAAQIVYVSAGGSLGGRGTITGDVINAGGTVAPGDNLITGGVRTAGVLTVIGTYSMEEPTSRLEVHVFGTNPLTIDKLIAANATLDGQLAVIGSPGAVAPGTTRDFLALSGVSTLTGNFTSTEQSGFDLGTTLSHTIGAGAATLSITAANPATTYLWLGGNGNWNDPTQWSTGSTPGAGAQVAIGAGTVTIDAGTSVALASLELAGGVLTGGGSITVADDFIWWGGALAGDVSVTTAEAAAVGIATQTQEDFGGLTLRDNARLEIGSEWLPGFGLTIQVDAGAPTLVLASTSVVRVYGELNFALTNGADFTLVNEGSLTLEPMELDWSGVTIVNRGTFALESYTLTLEAFEQQAGTADFNGAEVILPGGLLVSGGLLLAPSLVDGDVTVTGGTFGVHSYHGEVTGSFRLEAGGTLLSFIDSGEGYRAGTVEAASIFLAGHLRMELEPGKIWSSFLQDYFTVVESVSLTGTFASTPPAEAGIYFKMTLYTYDWVSNLTVSIEAVPQIAIWLGGDGNWSDATKWSTGMVPTYADEVHIGSGIVSIDSYDARVGSLFMTGGKLRSSYGGSYFYVEGAASFSDAGFEDVNFNFSTTEMTTMTGNIEIGKSYGLSFSGNTRIEDAHLIFTSTDEYATSFSAYFEIADEFDFVLSDVIISGNFSTYFTGRLIIEGNVTFEGDLNANGGLLITPGAQLKVEGDAQIDAYGGDPTIIQVDEFGGLPRSGQLIVLGDANIGQSGYGGELVFSAISAFNFLNTVSLGAVTTGTRSHDFNSITAEGFDADYATVFTTTAGITTLTITAISDNLIWIGADGLGGDGLWSDGANWSSGSAPTAYDDVLISAGAGVIDLGDNHEISVHELQMKGGTLSNGTIEILAGGEISGGAFAAVSLVIAENATVEITAATVVFSGATAPSLTVNLGGTLMLGGTGALQLNGAVELRIAGTVVVVSDVTMALGRVVLGIGGQAPPDELNGLLRVESGAVLTVGGTFEMAPDAISRIELELEEMVGVGTLQVGLLQIGGLATLDDELVVVVLNELTFTVPQSLVLVDAPTRSGSFASIAATGLPEGYAAVSPAPGDTITLVISAGIDFSTLVDGFNNGLDSLNDQLGVWLQSFNFSAGTFSLLPDALHDLFGLGLLTGEIVLPSLTTLPGSLAGLQSALEALGYTVDTLTETELQVRIDFNFDDLGVAAGFSGQLLNLAELEGLGTIESQPSVLPWLADLSILLVFGVDATGFYLDGDTALSLDVTLEETGLDVTGDLAGLGSLDLTGTLALAGNVSLLANNLDARYRGAEITGGPSAIFGPVAALSGDLSVGFALPYATLDFALSWSIATDGDRIISPTSVATLSGELALPGFKNAAGDQDALITLTASRTDEGWLLVATATEDLSLSGFRIVNLVITLDLTPTTYAGSGTGQVIVDGNAELGSLTLDFTLNFDATGYEITGTFVTGSATVGSGDPLLWLNNPTYTFNATATGSTLESATLGFAADDAVFFPDVSTLGDPLPAGPIHAETVAGTLSADGRLQLTAATVTVNFGEGLLVEVDGDVANDIPALSLDLDPTATAPESIIATLTGLRVSTPALLLGSLAVMQLQIRRNGFQLEASGALDAGARLQVGDPVVLEAAGLALNVDVTYTSGELEPITGVITLSATEAAIFPDLATQAIDGVATLTALTGSIDLATGAFDLTAGTFSLVAGDKLQLTATGTPENAAIHFVWDPADPDPAATILTVTALTFTLPGLVAPATELPTINLLEIRRNGFELAATFSLPGEVLTLGNPALIEIASPSFALAVSASGNGTVTMTVAATLSITADSATFAGPDSVSFTLNDDDAGDALPGVESLLDLTNGAFTLTARHAIFTLGDIVTGEIAGSMVEETGVGLVFVPAVSLSYDPTGPPSAQLLSFVSVEAELTVLSFNGLVPQVTLTGLSVTQSGDWSLASASVTLPVGYAGIHRLGIIPFRLDSISINFTTPGNFSLFDLSVSGRFELDGLSLGFTPVIYIGDPSLIGTGDLSLITVRLGDTTAFNFTLDSLSLFAGKFTPLNFGPITLGIEGLNIAGVTFDGQLSFGSFIDGLFVPLLNGFDVSGFLIITGGSDVPLAAQIDLSGNFTFPTLDLSLLELTTRFQFDGGALDLDLSFGYTTGLPSAPFFDLSFEANLGRISLQNLVFEIPDLFRITISEISLTINPGVGDPIATSTDVLFEFLAFPGFGPISLGFIELYQSGANIDGFILRNLLLVFSAELENSEGVTLVRLVDPRLVIDELSYLGGVLEGAIGFDAIAAILLPDVDPAIFTARGEGTDPLARGVTGNFDLDTGALSFAADVFTATFGTAVEISGEGFTFNYDPTVTDLTAPILTVGSATATATDFPDLGLGVLTGLVISRGSAAFESLTFGPGTANIEDVLAFDALTLSFDDVAYTYASGALTGTAILSAATASLFTGNAAFAATAHDLTGSFDLALGLDSFVITAAELNLAVHGRIELFAENVTFTFSGHTVATLASVEAQLPDFPGLGTATISELIITRDGFTASSAVFGPAQVTRGVLQFSNLTATLNEIAYDRAAGFTAGELVLAADGVVLFPSNTAVTATLEEVTATIRLTEPAGQPFTFSAAAFALTVGRALQIEGSDLSFTLGDGDDFTLVVTQAQASSPLLSGVSTELSDLTVTQDGFTLGSLILDAATATVAGLLEVTDLRFTISGLVFQTGEPLLGTVGFAASSALLLPALGAIAPRLTDDDAVDGIPGVSGQLDLATGVLTVEARRMEITLGGLIVIEVLSTATDPAIRFVDDPAAAPDDAMITIAQAVASIPALAVNGLAPTVTFTDFGLRRNGGYFQSSAVIDLPPGYPSVLGLGGILPLEITQLALDFPDPDNLDSFTFSVTGTFDLASLNLPFDPVLYIGDPALIGTGSGDLVTILPGSGTSFTLELNVESLREGKIAPVAFGPITLGVENLDLGGTVVSGVIELGRFEDGVLGPLPDATANVTGHFTIVSSVDGTLEIGAAIELTGNLETIAAGITRLALTGIVTGSGEIGSASGGVEIGFELTLTFTSQESSPFFSVQVEGRFLSVAFTDVTIDLGFIIIHAGRVEVVFNPAPGQAQYVLSEISIEFPAYETLTGTSVDLIEMFSDRFVIEGLTIELTGSLFPDNSFVELIDLAASIDAEIGYVRSGNSFSDFTLISGGVSFTVGELSLFPGSTTFEASATNLSGSLDVNTGELTLTAGSVTATVVDVLSLSLLNVELYLGNAPNRPVLQVATATATISALNDLAFTLTDLSLSRGGEFTLASAALSSPGGILASFGLGGLLPFEITDVLLEFADSRLDQIEITVTGSFDFSAFDSLPFTPVIRIGSVESTEAAPSIFEFTLAIGRLALGEISPINIGPIEIGFSDLAVGGVTLGGTIIFGGYANGLFVPSIGGSLSLGTEFKNLQGGVGISLLGTYDAAAKRLSINASFNVSFTLNDTIDVTGAALNFDLSFSLGGGGFTLDALAFTGASITRVEIRFGDLFIFTAVNVAIDFNPSPDGYFATFGALTVAFPGIGGLSGTAGNFGLRADFSFATLPGFFVSLTPPSGGLFGFPDWLPVTFETITLQFADIENDPLDVAITMTVSIDEGTFPLPISGRVEGLTIDIGLLRAGKFPITNLDAFVIEFGPIGFGGLELSGMLALGIAALDAGGNLLEGLDAQNDALVDQRILFGLIEGTIAVPGIGALTIRLGLSEFGPLVIFVSAELPIILEPTSGLTLYGLRGGVRFGAEFPSVTDPVTGLPDPELLRDPAFSPSGDMTAEQWIDALRQQISTIAQSGATPGQVTFADALNSPMLIELGASLGSAYLPGLTAEVDIIISTEGALLMTGALEYYLPGAMSAPFVLGEAKFFIDLRQIESGSVDIVFLLDVPGDPAVLTLSGFLSFDIVFDGQGEAIGFSLVIGGKAEISAIGVRLTGLLRLTVTTERTEIFVDASLEYPLLGPLNAQGLMVFDYSGDTVEVWGALSVSLSQSADLGPLGIEFDAGLTVQFNVSSSAKEIQFNFENTGEVIDVVIPANSFALFVNGFLYVKNNGDTLFALEGVFIIEIAADEGLTIFVEASLIIGASGPNAPPPLLQFSALGFLKLSTAGLAGKIEVSLDTNFPAAMGLELSGSFLLIVNTTGRTVNYTPPPIPGSSQTPTAVSIPGRLSPASSAGAYALIEAQGYLRVLGLTLVGNFSFAISADVLRVTANASLDIAVDGVNLLSLKVAGGFQIDRTGLVASLSMSLSAGSTSGDYAFGGSLSFLLEINTTGKAVTQIGNLPVNLAAGRYARVLVTGTLTVLGLELTGQFGIEVGTNGFSIAAAASLNLRVQGMTLFSFNVLGALHFGPKGFAAKFAISLGSQDSTTTGGSFSASFTLEINTTNQFVSSIAGITVNLAAGKYARVTAQGTLSVGGFDLVGSFIFEVTPTSISLNASISLSLKVSGVQVASFNGQAILVISNRGIVGLLQLSLSSGVNATTFGFQVAGIFQLEINTTSSQHVFAGGRPVLNAYTGVVVANQTEQVALPASTVRLYLAGSLITVVNGVETLRMQGYFEFTAGPSVISIRAFAYVNIGQFATLWGIGVMELRSTGLAASINISVLLGGTNVSGNGFTLGGTFLLEINTRATSVVLTNARPKLDAVTGQVIYGQYENVTIAARSFALVITGQLVLNLGGSGFTLQGRFEVRVSAQDLIVTASAVMEVRIGSREIFKLRADGALIITSQGIAASLSLTLQVGSTTNTTLGFKFNGGVSFVLKVNTTSTARSSIGGVTVSLPAGPYLYLAVAGSMEVAGLTLEGSFSFEVGTSVVSITANFTLNLKVGNVRVFSFTGTGALQVTSSGIAAYISLTLGVGPGSNMGFSLSADFSIKLRINTTGAAVSKIGTQAVSLEAGRYAEVTISGIIEILGVTIWGTFGIRVGTGGFEVAASGLLLMTVGNVRVISLQVTGALLINANGIAGKLSATLQAGPASTFRFSFGGNLSISVEINTTGQTVSKIAGVTVNLLAPGGGSYLRVAISGSLTLTSSFTLNGAFVLEVSGTVVRLSATANITVGPFANLNIAGSLTIRSNGIYGFLEINAGVRFTRNSAGITFDARLRLEINTTSTSQTVSRLTVNQDTGAISGSTTSVSISAQTVRVVIAGSVTMNGYSLFSVHGWAMLTFGATSLQVDFDAGLNLFGIRVNVDGSAGLYYGSNPGLALRIRLTVGSGGSNPNLSAVGNVFSFTGTFMLEINTRSIYSNGVSASTVRVSVANVRLSVAGFILSGSINIGISGGVFSITVPSNDPLTLNLWNFIVVSFSGTFRSSGYLSLTASARVQLGSNSWNVYGMLSVSFTLNNGSISFSARLAGGATIAGWSFDLASLTVNSSGVARFGTFLGDIVVNFRTGGIGFDGPVAGALVVFDANRNGIQDAGEPITYTNDLGEYFFEDDLLVYDANGNGVIDEEEGDLLLIGGRDVLTGLPVAGFLRGSAAQLGSGFGITISPLTTLVIALRDFGYEQTSAENLIVQRLFGVDYGNASIGFSIGNPYDGTIAGTPRSAELFKNNVLLIGTITPIAALLHAAGVNPDTDAATTAAYRAVAMALLAQPGVLNVGSAAVITDLINRAAEIAGVSLDGGLVTATADALAALNGSLNALDPSANGTGFASDVIRHQLVAQGELTTLAAAGNQAALVEAATTAGLVNLLNGANPPETDYPVGNGGELLNPDGRTLFSLESETPVLAGADGSYRVIVFNSDITSNPRNQLVVQRVVIDSTIYDEPVTFELRSSADGYQRVIATVELSADAVTTVVTLGIPLAVPVRGLGFSLTPVGSNDATSYSIDRLAVEGFVLEFFSGIYADYLSSQSPTFAQFFAGLPIIRNTLSAQSATLTPTGFDPQGESAFALEAARLLNAQTQSIASRLQAAYAQLIHGL